MTARDRLAVRTGRAREYAKIALRTSLYRRNLDLVRDPLPVRIANTLAWFDLDTVLDIGANLGQYGAALRAGRFSGTVISCEPLPDAYAHLARRAASDSRWITVPTAVGGEPGELVLNVSANSHSSSALPMTDAHLGAAPDSRYIDTHRVPVTTVAALVADHDVDVRRSLLKIDTQGYERPVLDGAGGLLGEFAAIQVELSLVPLYAGQSLAEELTGHLVDSGYGLYALEGGFSDRRSGRMLQYDGVFVRSDLLDADADANRSVTP